jgi:hypothetical protein
MAEHYSTLVDDPPTPAQFFALSHRSDRLSPEQRLFLALLTDAINIVLFPNRHGPTYRKSAVTEARSWVFDGDDGGPCSFQFACDALHIDADALRQGVQAAQVAPPPRRLNPFRVDEKARKPCRASWPC